MPPRHAIALALGVWASSASGPGAAPVENAAEIADLARGADIVLLGEIHDNPQHHSFQHNVLEALGASAIVFEMLSAAEAAQVTPDLSGQPEMLADVLDWENSGWPDFGMYAPLLGFAANIPIYGAEVERDAAQRAFAEGAAAVFGDGAADFALTVPLDADQQTAREAAQLAAHCDALPEDILPGFVEAQRLRDARLADAALRALDAHGGPVAVITGNGHARRDWGMAAVLATARPGAEVFALGQFEAPPDTPPPFDAWAVADPVERPDPCAAFR